MVDGIFLNFTLIPLVLILFLLLIGVALFQAKQSPIAELIKVYAEKAAEQGGFTSFDIEKLKMELGKNGIDPNKVTITITPEVAINITSEKYAKKGEIISIRLVNEDLGLIERLLKKIGNKENIKNSCIRYSMSEKN